MEPPKGAVAPQVPRVIATDSPVGELDSIGS